MLPIPIDTEFDYLCSRKLVLKVVCFSLTSDASESRHVMTLMTPVKKRIANKVQINEVLIGFVRLIYFSLPAVVTQGDFKVINILILNVT